MPDELGPDVAWLPGGGMPEALRSIARSGRHDLCHAHMTMAEAAALATRRRHRGRLVATRHFAAHRGSTAVGKLSAPWIARHLQLQLAISSFVDARLERPADGVLLNGTATRSVLWSAASRRVLLLQRLEPEKDTATALHAWRSSGLAARGWTLRVVGSGSQSAQLRALAAQMCLVGVEFAGYVRDVDAELRAAGMMLATAPAEPLGLSVIEAMAAGIPVVAAAGGGHLETIATVAGAPLFRPGDASGAAAGLAAMADDEPRRQALSHAVRAAHAQRLSLDGHVSSLLEHYALLGSRPLLDERRSSSSA